MSKSKTGERLPYLLGKLKAARVLERLEQTAALAREQSWPYERFLETLLEAEVFARDASGARTRIRHAGFPALKSLDDFDWSAQPGQLRDSPLPGSEACSLRRGDFRSRHLRPTLLPASLAAAVRAAPPVTTALEQR
jgi:DNA replication protein DnaC